MYQHVFSSRIEAAFTLGTSNFSASNDGLNRSLFRHGNKPNGLFEFSGHEDRSAARLAPISSTSDSADLGKSIPFSQASFRGWTAFEQRLRYEARCFCPKFDSQSDEIALDLRT